MAESAGPRRRRPPRRGVRLRGPVLHRLLDHPDVARRQPVADDRRRLRALRRGPRPAAGRPRPARPAGGLPPPPSGRDRRRARGAAAA